MGGGAQLPRYNKGPVYTNFRLSQVVGAVGARQANQFALPSE